MWLRGVGGLTPPLHSPSPSFQSGEWEEEEQWKRRVGMHWGPCQSAAGGNHLSRPLDRAVSGPHRPQRQQAKHYMELIPGNFKPAHWPKGGQPPAG